MIRIFVILISSFILLFSKPVKSGSIDMAIKDAAIILKVKVINNIFNDLNVGDSIEIDDYSQWSEYQVLDVYKNISNIKLQKTLKINEKSNSGYGDKYIVKKTTDNVLDFKRHSGNHQSYIKNYIMDINKTKVLFLDEDFNHFGWFISPQDFSKELEDEISTRK